MGVEDPTLDELERVYRSQFRAFIRTATAYLGDAEAARDAVQDGVAAAIRARAGYHGTGTVEAWVWAAVLNSVRNHRARARPAVPLGAAHTARGEDPIEKGARGDDVRSAVRRLPERQRLVLFLRFYADMDYATIANLLAINPGTVAASLNAARAALRGRLEEVRT